MNTIFDEIKYCEELLSAKPDFVRAKYLFVLIKYYKYLGFGLEDSIERIKTFCIDCDPNYNFVIAEGLFRKIRAKYKHAKINIPKDIPITKNEMSKIRSLLDYKKEKLLFTMLVLAKYEHGSSEKYYLNDVKDSSLFKLAKLYIRRPEREKMRYELCQSGLITSLDGQRQSYIINFVDESGELYTTVNDMENLVSFYPYFYVCEKCGSSVEKKIYNTKTKLCDDCYMEKRVDRLEKLRIDAR